MRRNVGVSGQDVAWAPPEFDYQIVMAMKALHAGEASPSQQVFAIKWITERAAAMYEVSFRPEPLGGDRGSAFAEGRRFVGIQIAGLVNMAGPTLEQLRSKQNG